MSKDTSQLPELPAGTLGGDELVEVIDPRDGRYQLPIHRFGLGGTAQQKADFRAGIGFDGSATDPIKIIDNRLNLFGTEGILRNTGGRVQFYANSFGTSQPNIIHSLCGHSGGALKHQESNGSSVGGNTSAAILARVLANGFDPRADVVMFQEGTNDAGQSVANATHISNMAAIANEIKKANKIPVLLLSPPRGSTFVSEVNQYALRERFMCESLGIPYYDPWFIHCDTNGAWKAGVATDTIHPTTSAVSIAGKSMWDEISASRRPRLLPRTNSGQGIFGANVLQLTDTNADGLPDGWIGSKFAGATYTTPDAVWPFVGKTTKIDFSGLTAQSFHYKETNTGYSVGDVIRFSGFAGLTGATNCLLTIRIICNNSGTGIYYPYISSVSDGLKYFETDFTVLPGTTAIQMTVLISPASGSGSMSGTLEFGGMDCYNVTTLSQ